MSLVNGRVGVVADFPPHVPPPSDGAAEAEWVAWANGLPTFVASGLTCTALTPDGAVVVVPEEPPFPANPNGAVNGGFLAAVMDQVMGALASCASPPGFLPATAALQTQYHRPSFGPLTMTASVIPGGRRVLFIDVVVEDRHGVRCASGSGTMIVGGAGRPPQADTG